MPVSICLRREIISPVITGTGLLRPGLINWRASAAAPQALIAHIKINIRSVFELLELLGWRPRFRRWGPGCMLSRKFPIGERYAAARRALSA